MRPELESPFPIFQYFPHFCPFSSVYPVLLNSLLEKWNKILHFLLIMLQSGLTSGKYITKLNVLIYDLKDKRWTNILRMSSCQEAEKSLCLAVGTQNQYIGKLFLASVRSLTVLMMMSNAFSVMVIPVYLFCEVLCLVKCQSTAFPVGSIFHLNALEQDFRWKYSSPMGHIKLFSVPLLLWGPARSILDETFSMQVLSLA